MKTQREKSREWRENHPGYYSSLCKSWRARNPAKAATARRKYRLANLDKANARNRVYRALKSGKLVRGLCWCGRVGSHAHHANYSNALEVTWLCGLHHKNLHRKNNAVERQEHTTK